MRPSSLPHSPQMPASRPAIDEGDMTHRLNVGQQRSITLAAARRREGRRRDIIYRHKRTRLCSVNFVH